MIKSTTYLSAEENNGMPVRVTAYLVNESEDPEAFFANTCDLVDQRSNTGANWGLSNKQQKALAAGEELVEEDCDIVDCGTAPCVDWKVAYDELLKVDAEEDLDLAPINAALLAVSLEAAISQYFEEIGLCRVECVDSMDIIEAGIESLVDECCRSAGYHVTWLEVELLSVVLEATA